MINFETSRQAGFGLRDKIMRFTMLENCIFDTIALHFLLAKKSRKYLSALMFILIVIKLLKKRGYLNISILDD